MELWRDIEGYEGLYQISNLGRIKGLDRVNVSENGRRTRVKSKVLHQTLYRGYYKIRLSKGNRKRDFYTHRLVAFAFCEKPDGKNTVNHIDGVKNNNVSRNLEWVTQKENVKHAWESGLAKVSYNNLNGNYQGEMIKASKLKDEDVLYIRKNSLKNGGSMTIVELSKKFGVGTNTVSKALSYKTWKHIK